MFEQFLQQKSQCGDKWNDGKSLESSKIVSKLSGVSTKSQRMHKQDV